MKKEDNMVDPIAFSGIGWSQKALKSLFRVLWEKLSREVMTSFQGIKF